MSTERRERVQVFRDEDLQQRQEVVERKPSTQRVVLSRVSQFIWLITAGIVILLAFRFVLMLLAANPANAFASIIYGISDVLVGPFVGLLNSPAFTGGSIVDVPSLVALVVYPLLAWALVQLLHILFADSGGMRRVKTVRREKLD
ncbi:MAG: hypothetical protein K8J31_19695 [Anaerolineae bacterium]|nr:hypothetical protein [Anaerolineae bacterium]